MILNRDISRLRISGNVLSTFFQIFIIIICHHYFYVVRLLSPGPSNACLFSARHKMREANNDSEIIIIISWKISTGGCPPVARYFHDVVGSSRKRPTDLPIGRSPLEDLLFMAPNGCLFVEWCDSPATPWLWLSIRLQDEIVNPIRLLKGVRKEDVISTIHSCLL